MSTNYNRRNFIKRTALWTAAGTLPVVGAVRARGTDPVIVSLFLRGGADALNICVPNGDDEYYRLRPNIAIKADGYTKLTDFFGLHNSFNALMPLYEEKALGFIHCAGNHDKTRSHFEAQDYMDAGVQSDRSIGTGWLARTLTALDAPISHAGVSIGKQTNKAFLGPVQSSTMTRILELRKQQRNLSTVRGTLSTLYDPGSDPVLGGAVSAAFSSLDTIAGVSNQTEVPYPREGLSRSLKDVAAIIKADIGVRLIALNLGGWDHHTDETNRMETRGIKLGPALAAFRKDLGADFDRTLFLCMTEFGRTAKENGGDGTDHGHGSFMIGMGGRLQQSGGGGGRVILANNTWPGLTEDALYDGRHLEVTTDYRDVFAEALDKHMGLSGSFGSILPGHTVDRAKYPGLI